MRQAIHIFEKDAFYLRYELALAMAMLAAFVMFKALSVSLRPVNAAGSSVVSMALPLMWWFSISRVIHAERLPGDRQFWITRPYRWKSLLWAKVLFVVAFIHVPMFLAQWAILSLEGFPLGGQIPGLLWSQVLMASCFVLPMAALAAVTTGFVQVLLVVLMGALTFGISVSLRGVRSLGTPTEWIGSSVMIPGLAAVFVAVAIWQYSRRKTGIGRAWGAIGIVVASLAGAFFPWSASVAIQQRLSEQMLPDSVLQVTLDAESIFPAAVRWSQADAIQLEIPLKVTAIPEHVVVKPDEGDVVIAGVGTVDQGMWQYGTGARVWKFIYMKKSVFEGLRGRPVTIRGSIMMTVYGNKTSKELTINRPEQVPGVGICSLTGSDQAAFISCGYPFRLPARNVIAFRELVRPMTYSPFPAALSEDPVTRYGEAAVLGSKSSVVISVMEPLSHVRRDFAVSNVRLPDFGR